MNQEYKDNPNYQNGFYWGKNTVKFIAQTNYRTLKTAILIKEELIKDFEQHFGWDMSNKDYAETMGAIDAFKEAEATNQKADEQGSDSTGSAG
jgi:hypothetical protein